MPYRLSFSTALLLPLCLSGCAFIFPIPGSDPNDQTDSSSPAAASSAASTASAKTSDEIPPPAVRLPSAYIKREKIEVKERIVVERQAPKLKTLDLSASDNFEYNKAILSKNGVRNLDKALLDLTIGNVKSITVEGHTDSIGSDEYNQKLSERRAAAVRGYMVSRGVPGELILASGKGKHFPIASNDTESGRAQNRRVTVTFETYQPTVVVDEASK